MAEGTEGLGSESVLHKTFKLTLFTTNFFKVVEFMKGYKIVRRCAGCREKFSPGNANRLYCRDCRPN